MLKGNGSKRHAGFTLIEVMVALAIVGMAIPALVMRVQSILNHTAYMEDKTYAYWVAQNKMEEIKLDIQFQKKLRKTKDNDTTEFANREWYWEYTTEQTPVEKMLRINLRVGVEPGKSLASMSGFLYIEDGK